MAEALAALPVPESTGPVSRSDRTAVLLPQLKPEQQAEAAAAPAPTRPSRDERRRAKEQAAEGRFWPVVIALLLAALVGSALGWLLLGRNRQSNRPAQRLHQSSACRQLSWINASNCSIASGRCRSIRPGS